MITYAVHPQPNGTFDVVELDPNRKPPEPIERTIANCALQSDAEFIVNKLMQP